MMNIFIMILVSLFMVGFYMMTAPSQRVVQHESEFAINRADMRAIAECAAAQHNAQIQDTEFVDICTEQYGIVSQFVCTNSSGKITKCDVVRNKKPDASYILTATAPIPNDQYNNMMEIMEQYYADAGSFGILMNGRILSGGTTNHRTIPDAIIKQAKLSDGALVYLTQYETPDATREYNAPDVPDLQCPDGTIKTYRFGRWQCIEINQKTNCGGDTVWDSDTGACVADESRKPLCGGDQTAIMIDSVWECVNPKNEITCPTKMIARYNYNTFGWECVPDPDAAVESKKCSHTGGTLVYGAIGSTLRVTTTTSCTDCEVMVTDTETCATACVPDASKLNDPKCYPGAVAECRGPSRGFYFGFPSAKYIANIADMPGDINPDDIKIGGAYSQNRKFNCMDCGAGIIDTDKSVSPYTAICK